MGREIAKIARQIDNCQPCKNNLMAFLEKQMDEMNLRTTRSKFLQQCVAAQKSRTSPFAFLEMDEDDVTNIDQSTTLLPKITATSRNLADLAAAKKQKKIDAQAKEDASRGGRQAFSSS